MRDGVQLDLPRAAAPPWRSLLRRLGVAVAIVLLIALLAYADRSGYKDDGGAPLSFLDAVYYATVTVTTTGYGDIAPISPSARAITAFVVTPLRIVFLIVLVGTTLELLTERFRRARAVARWRDHVDGHTIVIGYGTMGAAAVQTLLAEGADAANGIIVIDREHAAAARAQAIGLVTIVADATRTETLREACIEKAASVVVTCNRDDTATLVTLTARELNPRATIAAAVKEAENAHLLVQSGATDVVLSSQAAGRLVGLATRVPAAVGVLQELLTQGHGLDLVERPVTAEEVGAPLDHARVDGLPIAIVRGTQHLPPAGAQPIALQHGDVIVAIRRAPN